MARTAGSFVENQFVAGLITEATGLNFPEKAVTETWNTRYHSKGNVKRRLGFDLENDVMSVVANVDQGVCRSYLWKGVGDRGDKTFLVVQSGSRLTFYEPDDSGSFGSGVKAFGVELEEFKTTIPGVSVSDKEASMASGIGKLFVVHPYCDPIYITYNEVSDSITTVSYTIEIRDFEGVEDGLEIDERPATLSTTHKYNLYNQGWYIDTVWADDNGNENPVDFFYRSSINPEPAHVYPSNADVWWYYKNSKEEFDPNPQAKIMVFGNTPAAKGHYIYNAFQTNRSGQERMLGPLTETSSEGTRPSCVAFYAGRVWYSGVHHPKYGGNVYYTQIIERDDQIGRCHQLNDPTNENLSDLLDTDGGVIKITGMGKATALFSTGNNLLVFANNGLWGIGGSGAEGTGFVATDFSVNQITRIGLDQQSSLVEAENTPFWWTLDGIYTIKSEGGVTSITNDTIKTFFQNDIPAGNKNYAQGSYNPLEKTIQWLWKSTLATSIQDNYQYDRILEINLSAGSFYPHKWSINDQAFNSVFCASGISKIPQSLENVVDSTGAVVTDSTPANVQAYVSDNPVFFTSQFKYIAVMDTGSINGVVNGHAWGADTFAPGTTYSISDPGSGYGGDEAEGIVVNWERGKVYKLLFAYSTGGSPGTHFGVTTYDLNTEQPTGYINLKSLLSGVCDPDYDEIEGYHLLPKSFIASGDDLLSIIHSVNAAPGGAAKTWRCTVVNADLGTVLASTTITSNVGADTTAHTNCGVMANIGDTPTVWYYINILSRPAFGVDKFSVLEITSDGATATIVERLVDTVIGPGTLRFESVSTVKSDAAGVDFWTGHVPGGTGFGPDWVISHIRFPYPYSAPVLTNPIATLAVGHNDWEEASIHYKAVDGTNYLVFNWVDGNGIGNDAYRESFDTWSFDTPTGTYTKLYSVNRDLEDIYGGNGQTPQILADNTSSIYGFQHTNSHREGHSTVLVQSLPNVGFETKFQYCVLCVPDGAYYTPGYVSVFDLPGWNGFGVTNPDDYFGARVVTSIPDNRFIASGQVEHVKLPDELFDGYTTELLSWNNPAWDTVCGGIAFWQEDNTSYYDFVTRQGPAQVDYSSYFLSGSKVHGEGHKSGNIDYITMFGNYESTSSAYVRARWDWSNSSSTGKWSTEQQVYSSKRSNRDVSRKRLLVRGSGPALQLYVRSQAGKPFDLIGWTSQESIDGNP